MIVSNDISLFMKNIYSPMVDNRLFVVINTDNVYCFIDWVQLFRRITSWYLFTVYVFYFKKYL